VSAWTRHFAADWVSADAPWRNHTFNPYPCQVASNGSGGNCQPASFRTPINASDSPIVSSPRGVEDTTAPLTSNTQALRRTSIFWPENGLSTSTSLLRFSPLSRFARGPCDANFSCNLSASTSKPAARSFAEAIWLSKPLASARASSVSAVSFTISACRFFSSAFVRDRSLRLNRTCRTPNMASPSTPTATMNAKIWSRTSNLSMDASSACLIFLSNRGEDEEPFYDFEALIVLFAGITSLCISFMLLANSPTQQAGSPRLFRSDYRHPAVFYRGVETPASFSFRSISLYRRAPANACARVGRQPHAIHRQTAGSYGRIGEVTGVIMDARPSPFARDDITNCFSVASVSRRIKVAASFSPMFLHHRAPASSAYKVDGTGNCRALTHMPACAPRNPSADGRLDHRPRENLRRPPDSTLRTATAPLQDEEETRTAKAAVRAAHSRTSESLRLAHTSWIVSRPRPSKRRRGRLRSQSRHLQLEVDLKKVPSARSTASTNRARS